MRFGRSHPRAEAVGRRRDRGACCSNESDGGAGWSNRRLPMNLFFDLDGTLTDSKPGIVASIRYGLRAVSVEAPPDDDLARLIGPPTFDAFAQLLGTADRPTLERAVQAYRDRYATVGLFESRVYPGVAEGLGALHAAGLRLCVVTSKPHVYARRIMEHFGLRGFFREVYGSELSGLRG